MMPESLFENLPTVFIQQSRPPFDTGPSLLWMLVQTIFMLAFICALAYIVVRLLKRFGGAPASSNLIEIIDRVALDQRKGLYVIKVTGRYLLIGTSDNGVQLIGELDADAVEREAQTIERQPDIMNSARAMFTDRFEHLLKKRDKR
jgi:flagellar biosynthetic protein FliO